MFDFYDRQDFNYERIKKMKNIRNWVAFDRRWLIIGDVSQDFVNLRAFHVIGWNI